MSLTNPVLNDIVVKELTELSTRINTLNSDISGRFNSISAEINTYNNKLIKQDAKIDLIHKLFNSVKNNSSNNNNSHDSTKDHIDTKKYTELENSMNEKYGIFVERVMNIISQYNIHQEHNMTILNQNYNNVNDALSNMRTSINSVTKNMNDIVYRLNGLERKYRYLDDTINLLSRNDESYDKRRDDSDENYGRQVNTDSNQKDPENWVKVTKKHRKHNGTNFYNNRY